jgi:hypothetical protein
LRRRAAHRADSTTSTTPEVRTVTTLAVDGAQRDVLRRLVIDVQPHGPPALAGGTSEVTVRDADTLVRALRQFRDAQVHGIQHLRASRPRGAPLTAAAHELLAAAERLAAISGLLAQLEARAD